MAPPLSPIALARLTRLVRAHYAYTTHSTHQYTHQESSLCLVILRSLHHRPSRCSLSFLSFLSFSLLPFFLSNLALLPFLQSQFLQKFLPFCTFISSSLVFLTFPPFCPLSLLLLPSTSKSQNPKIPKYQDRRIPKDTQDTLKIQHSIRHSVSLCRHPPIYAPAPWSVHSLVFSLFFSLSRCWHPFVPVLSDFSHCFAS